MRIAVLLLAVLGAPLALWGQAPPLIAPTDPLTPEEQRQKFHLPPGFEIQLVVSEDSIGQPMNLNFDAAGRLWITSSVTYPYPVEGEGTEPRDERFGPNAPPPARDHVTVVEGIGPDGKPESVRQFAGGLNIPIGIVPVHDGTIVFDIPAIRLHRDTDGDGIADETQTLIEGFGNVDTHGMTNAFTYWIDGWIYACHGFKNTSHLVGADGRQLTLNSGNVYRFRGDGTGLEQFTWGQVNPYGLTIDQWGDLYSADCHSKPLTLLLRGAHYPSFGKPHDGLGFGPNMIDHSHGSTGICGPAYYAATQFPPEYRDNLYLCNPVTSRVHRDRLVDSGSTRLVDTQPDFVTCDDLWFRPVDLQVGPDGCLYIADFYNAIIGHYEVELKHPKRDQQHGRVWRVVYRGEDGKVEPPSIPNLTTLTVDELAEKLGDPNLTVRTLATNRLVDHFGAEAIPKLRPLLDSEAQPEARVDALWAMFRLGELDDQQLIRLSQDASPLVRTHVARVLAEREGWSNDSDVLATVRKLCRDENAFVRRAAVDALGREPRPDAIPLLLSLYEETPAEDTHLRHTIRIALRNQLRDEEHPADELLATSSGSEALRELMSVSLAVPSEASAGFLAEALPSCDEPPSQILDYARHIARYGSEQSLEQTVDVLEARFQNDLSRQLGMMLAIREGLEQRGGPSNEFMRRRSTAWARRLLQTGDDKTIQWQTVSIDGTAGTDQPWTVEELRCADGQSSELFSTLPRGEQATGIHRSAAFALPETLSFYIAGHCGRPQRACHGRNRVRLLDAETGLVIAEGVAPRNDVAQQVVWDLHTHTERKGYLELVDGDAGTAYAWLAAGRFSIDRLNSAGISPLDAAVELIAQYQLNELTPELQELLADHTAEMSRRSAAAKALVALQPDARLQALLSFAGDLRVTGQLQGDTLAAVETREPEAITANLAAVMQSLPAAQQEEFAKLLSGDRTGGEALLGLIESGKASRWLLLDEALKRRLILARVSDVDRRLGELTRGLPSRDEQITTRIALHRDSFNPQATSSERGREVFEKQCAICHRIGEKGSLIGPQLDGVGIRGIDRLLEDILDPNRNVDAAFQTTTIVLDDGKLLTGLYRRQEGETLVFADQKGKEFTLPTAEIDEQATSPVSLMPANLAELVTPPQVDDLLAFLLEQRAPVPPKSESH